MFQSVPIMRVLSVVLMTVVIVSLASGCSRFRKGEAKGDYALSPELRPLEVPPDLNLPDTSSALNLPTAHSGTRPTGGSAANMAAQDGFVVTGVTQDDAFALVGQALERIDGVNVVAQARLLGSYDVEYQGQSFLIRVANGESGVQVSAMDGRGLPATGQAASRLIAELRTVLSQLR